MNIAIGLVLVDLLLVVGGWAILIPMSREFDKRRQADDTGDHAETGVRKSSYEQYARAQAAGQLLSDQAAAAGSRPPWQPRISARRVTAANRIRWAYALADYPVPGYSWALRTTAQEVTP